MHFLPKLFIAVDTPSLEQAKQYTQIAQENTIGVKLGLEFFLAQGPEGVAILSQLNVPIFLDLKLYDIPNTVVSACAAILKLPNIVLTTFHVSGGMAMLSAVTEFVSKEKLSVKTLGVTVLTSMEQSDVEEVWPGHELEASVIRLAKLSKQAGLNGIVCSAHEAKEVKKCIGKNFLCIVPGIRFKTDLAGDQKRIMTPKQAVLAGADILVVGRSITTAENPSSIIQDILTEINSAVALGD